MLEHIEQMSEKGSLESSANLKEVNLGKLAFVSYQTTQVQYIDNWLI